MILKGTLAATIAWIVADVVISAQSPAFAPFTAVVMVQISVRESVLRSLRFAVAAIAGVSLQGLLAFWLEPHAFTFAAVALVALVALVLGYWHRLGAQGSLVSTSAFFAYSVFVAQQAPTSRLPLLAELILLVLVGCTIGIMVNLAVYPPLRLRGADYALSNLSSALRDLLGDLAAVLAEREPSSEEPDAFWYRGQDIESLASQVHGAITSARTPLRWNPRRLLLRRTPQFAAYADLAFQMARVGETMRSVTDILRRLPAAADAPGREFLRRYGGFMSEVSCAVAQLVDLDPGDVESVRHAFREHLDRARGFYKDPGDEP